MLDNVMIEQKKYECNEGYKTRIRELRKYNRLTLKELSEKLNTTPQTLQRLETDTMTVSINWLHRIAEALNVKCRDLIPDGNNSNKLTSDEENYLIMLRADLDRLRRFPKDATPDDLLVLQDACAFVETLRQYHASRISRNAVVASAARLSATSMYFATKIQDQPDAQ